MFSAHLAQTVCVSDGLGQIKLISFESVVNRERSFGVIFKLTIYFAFPVSMYHVQGKKKNEAQRDTLNIPEQLSSIVERREILVVKQCTPTMLFQH